MPLEKIIVLEDDPIVRKNLESQLRQRRYDVAATGTIAGAHEILSKDTFDLIFVDVRLPDGEGTELLRELQSPQPLVVMVSASVPWSPPSNACATAPSITCSSPFPTTSWKSP